ncbi:ScbA/BarX family gamma-butyrolactone biosynthesis protein [Nocardia sp. SYP-A9097]|uniref:ScbA/BarX family gamma-butyrolactone biosynthesis protein n=1 Tax=Nocardia sp. SYP-A9097 TaxID=2663237 RepID=UPI001891900F|nr:ScbA/BarX family gamma-butyrolactone biosynthesis protein [Nocardia sp. SYP-A9097]
MTVVFRGPETGSDLGIDELTFDRTVPRGLVHRAAVGEVFVTDAAAIGENRFKVAAQLPRGHALYGDRIQPLYDPLMVLEATRQAAILLTHQFYGVPRNWAFIFRKADLAITDPVAMTVVDLPGHLLIQIDMDKRFYADGKLTGTHIICRFELDGRAFGTLIGSLSFTPPEFFAVMRAAGRAGKELPPLAEPNRATPIDPQRVGRFNRRNVVIAATGDRELFELIVDHSHPSLCDHKVDHVSGMLLTEGCRQAAVSFAAQSALAGIAVDQLELLRFQVDFRDFAELELPVYCRMTRCAAMGSGRVAVDFDLEQGGRTIAGAQAEVGSWM